MSRSGQLWMDEVEHIVEEYLEVACATVTPYLIDRAAQSAEIAEARERALGKLVAHGFDLKEANDQLDEATA